MSASTSSSESSASPSLRLHVLSLRYSSWSIRPYLALKAAGLPFAIKTIELPDLGLPLPGSEEGDDRSLVDAARERLSKRRALGSVTGNFPVLFIGNAPIHESLAIGEWVAEQVPGAGLWPSDSVARAKARAVSSEMASSFGAMRNEMSSHVFARVPNFESSPETRVDVLRVLDIWRECLAESGGPFLFGAFGIADCMYFPVLGRFRTYGVDLEPELERYAQEVEGHPAVRAFFEEARVAPRIPIYDEYVRGLGGDPDAGLD